VPPIFGRAAITLGIGPHSSLLKVFAVCSQVAEALLEKETLTYKDMEQLIGPPTFGKSLRYDWRNLSKTSTPSTESPATL